MQEKVSIILLVSFDHATRALVFIPIFLDVSHHPDEKPGQGPGTPD